MTERVVLAYSGGLDTSVAIQWIAEETGADPAQITRAYVITREIFGLADYLASLRGGEGQRWWFLNGEPLAVKSRVYTLQLDKSGDYQVLVMDEAGQVATVNFTLQ